MHYSGEYNKVARDRNQVFDNRQCWKAGSLQPRALMDTSHAKNLCPLERMVGGYKAP